MIAVVVAAGATLLVIGVVVALGGGGSEPSPVAAEPTAAPAGTSAATGAYDYLKAVYTGTSHAGYLDSITRLDEGEELTVHTNLFPKAEVKDLAMALCTVLTTYDTRPIRVLDRAKNILVSRRTGGTCEWRR